MWHRPAGDAKLASGSIPARPAASPSEPVQKRSAWGEEAAELPIVRKPQKARVSGYHRRPRYFVVSSMRRGDEMASTLSGRSRRSETTAAGDDRRQGSASNRPWRPKRRDVIRLAAASMGASLTGGFHAAAVAAPTGAPIRRSNKPLRAAFSNIGLQVTWCAQGKEAAEFWGKLFNVDVTWFDAELSATQQMAALEEIASRDWDFVAIQAVEIDTLAAPVNRMIDAGIPVIDMDTLDRATGSDRRAHVSGSRQ